MAKKGPEYHPSRVNAVVVDGKLLADARIAANLSLQDVANHLGCNKSSVSRWEQGTLTPTEERITKMMKLFKRGDFVIANKNLEG